MKGEVNYKGLVQLKQLLENAINKDMDDFSQSLARELAGRLLSKVIKKTPVGKYDSGSGRVGGTLRRGWTGGKRMSGEKYVQSLPIEEKGNSYTVTLHNPVEYASFVEYGHRQTPGRYVPAINSKLKKSWVEGRFFMTRSENEASEEFPRISEMRMEQQLKRILRNGK